MASEEPFYRIRRRADRLEREEARKRKIELWSVIVVGVTAMIALIAALAALEQVNQMIISQRPWLSVSPEVRGPLIFVESFHRKTVHLTITYKLKVLGPTPARNVTVTQSIVPHPGGANIRSLDSPLARLCDLAESNSEANSIGGPMVFPGEPRLMQAEVSSEPTFPDGRPVVFTVQGCVDYTYAADRHGKAAFRMILGRSGAQFWEGLDFLPPTPSGDGKVTFGTTSLDRERFNFEPDLAGGDYVR